MEIGLIKRSKQTLKKQFFPWFWGLCFCFLGLWTPPSMAQEGVSINFRDVEIRLIVESISRILDQNVMIDPRVRGQVTIMAEKSVPESELLDVMLMILSVYGFTAVETNGMLVVMPTQVSSNITATRSLDGNYELVTEILQIYNVPAASMVQVLQPFMSQSARAQLVPGTDKLILSDTRINVDRIKSIIKDVDRPAVADFDVIRLNYISVNEAMTSLRNVFTGMAVKFEADRRANRLLVISNSPDMILSVRAIIAELDREFEMQQTGNMNVFYLRYAEAAKLAPIITELLGSQAYSNLDIKVQGAPVPAAGSNSGGGQTTGEVGFNEEEETELQFSVQADEDLNALIVVGEDETLRAVELLLDKLDMPRAQIAIEIIIAEISDSKAREIGIDFSAIGKSGAFVMNLTQKIDWASVIETIGSGATVGDNEILAALNLMLAGSAGVGVGGNGWGSLITAIQTDDQSRLLSTPYVTVLDNGEARFVVGEERPFVTGSYTSTGGGSTPDSPFQTIERRNVGIEITIKPRINRGNSVTLEVEQIISSVLPDSSGSDTNVVTSNRELNTTVIAPSGDVVIMGGLRQGESTISKRGIPLLSKIPLLGRLFQYESVKDTNRSLIIFMRPTILSSISDITDMSLDKYESFRELLMNYRLNATENAVLGSIELDREKRQKELLGLKETDEKEATTKQEIESVMQSLYDQKLLEKGSKDEEELLKLLEEKGLLDQDADQAKQDRKAQSKAKKERDDNAKEEMKSEEMKSEETVFYPSEAEAKQETVQ